MRGRRQLVLRCTCEKSCPCPLPQEVLDDLYSTLRVGRRGVEFSYGSHRYYAWKPAGESGRMHINDLGEWEEEEEEVGDETVRP